MPIYHLFISHSWNYADAYERLIQMLRAHPELDFRNFSVPSYAPIVDAPTGSALERALEAKIHACSIVLVMAGVYASYGHWINKELEIARRLGKPVIAVKPWGSERISLPVRAAAKEECPWNSACIVRAITRWA